MPAWMQVIGQCRSNCREGWGEEIKINHLDSPHPNLLPLEKGPKTCVDTYAIAPSSNRLLTVQGPAAKTYSYDAAGNLTSAAATTFTWNAAGRLSKAASGGQNYTYTDNGLGERILKNGTTLANGPYRFVYDHAGHLIGEYDKNNSLKQETVWMGDTPVAVVKSAPAPQQIHVYFIQADHLNAPRVILNNANTPVWRWDTADAFGITLPNEDPDGDGNTFEYNLRFPGQYYDQETSLHYNYFRDYDPSTGRYIASDPIGLSGGLNTYTYVENNPLRWVDPSGLVVDFDGPDKAVQVLQNTYNKIKTTEKGRQLCEILENSPDTYLITNKFPYKIPGFKPDKAFYHEVSKTIIVDPTYHPRLTTNEGPQRAPTESILGHEIGHAATGIEDDGPNRMNNVNANENPIRQELGLPSRTNY
ncbi:MAG: RHS repeat-associated core domain-containing protein, partial [Methylococcaceae bacterium]|nr:RHS repeat-associated core domain-containing protein [Methylococcaceae bacterium]MDP3932302.1 RHS repeat-associated core domain-containing protein [Methylococcaceae bacterium]MDZ4156505.1 RHS repeat-associated core domain-containing protein [Methylococcales bacterium]